MESQHVVRGLQKRGLTTRAALLDAALECLVERGYADTTLTEVAARAGLSRGAQLHHFPTKAELLTAAVGHLFDRRIAEFRKAFANFDTGADQLESTIDLLWSMYQGPSFVAWVELWVAARNDETLRVAVVEMDRHFEDQSRAVYAELFPDANPDDIRFQELGRRFAYALMDGLALQKLVDHDHHLPAEDIIAALKAITRLIASPAEDHRIDREDIHHKESGGATP